MHSCAGTGSREDTPCAFGDYRDETSDNIKGDHSSYVENSSCAKYSHPHGLDSKVASNHPYQENKLAAEGITVPISPILCLAGCKN